MKKPLQFLTLSLLVAAAPLSSSAQSVFNWDVDNAHNIQAIDAGTFNIGYFDQDGLTPNANTGFPVGSYEIFDDGGNMVAAATSWFDPPAQADNWIIFGPITHPGNVSSVLTWEHRIVDDAYRDGYEVLVTSAGPSPIDFGGATVIKSFSDNDAATAGNQTLTQQSANLPAALMGGPVYIAFHHQASDMYLLFLDNFDVTQTVTGTMPTADFSANTTTIAPGAAVDFTDLSTGTPTAWDWTFTGANTTSSTSQNPTNIVYPTVGCYDVSLTSSNASGSDTETKNCYIDVTCPPFSAGFAYTAAGLAVTFTNICWNVESYDWNFGDGNSSVAPNPINNYAAAGTYSVTLQGFDDCSGTSDLAAYNITIDDSTNSSNVSIEDHATLIYNMSVYPNPSTGVFNVNFDVNSVEDVVVNVYNSVGQAVVSKNFAQVSGQFTSDLDLTGMASGIYMMEVTVGNSHQTKRIVLK